MRKMNNIGCKNFFLPRQKCDDRENIAADFLQIGISPGYERCRPYRGYPVSPAQPPLAAVSSILFEDDHLLSLAREQPDKAIDRFPGPRRSHLNSPTWQLIYLNLLTWSDAEMLQQVFPQGGLSLS